MKLLLAKIITLAILAYIPKVPLTNGSLCTKLDTDFKEVKYSVPICYRNVSYTTKYSLFDSYNIDKELRYQYTIDHIIPLFVGGSNHKDNLWPQHRSIYTGGYENSLYHDLKSGRKSVSEVISLIKNRKGIR